MGITNLTKENFDKTIEQNDIVFIDCWASWCEACKDFGPVFEKVSEMKGNITFAKIDTMKEKELIKSLNVEHIPTLLLFRDNIMLFKQAGYFEESKLLDILDQAQSLDMDMVRADIEEQKNDEN